VEIARGIYREARELYRQGKLKEALDKALDAYRTAATPVTALQAGQLLIESGRLVEARDLVRGVGPMPVSPRESEKGREARQQATAIATSLDMRIPKVAVSGRPKGVDVLLDGKPLSAGEPAAWQGVDPGSHTLVVRMDDRTCSTITVTLAETEVRTIDLHDLTASCRPEAPAPEPPRSAPPPLRPPAEPPAEVLRAPLPEAEHGANAWKVAGVTLGGLGAVAIGVGGYIALKAKSDYDSAAVQCPSNQCDAAGYRARTDARSQADGATVAMSLGGAAVVGGVLMWLLAPDYASKAASAAWRPQVAVGPGRLAVTVQVP
jgi:serine/threonine-protein kinase